jgi:hypothetical protein
MLAVESQRNRLAHDRRRRDEIEVLISVAQRLNDASGADELMQSLVDSAVDLTESRSASLWTFENGCYAERFRSVEATPSPAIGPCPLLSRTLAPVAWTASSVRQLKDRFWLFHSGPSSRAHRRCSS